jgi:hypothetical protein
MRDPVLELHLAERSAMAWKALAVLLIASLAGFGVARLAIAAGTEPPGLNVAIRDAFREPSTCTNSRDLAANTAETMAVPTCAQPAAYPSARVGVILSATCSNWFLKTNGTATVPGDITDGDGSERSPVALSITQATNLSMIADAACKVTGSFYIMREP